MKIQKYYYDVSILFQFFNNNTVKSTLHVMKN